MAVSEEVMDTLGSLEDRLERLEEKMRKLLNSWSPAALALLSPAERASAYLAVSKALNAVYCLFLRTRGESPDDHPVKSELERTVLFEDKVRYGCDRYKAPRMSLDMGAATRFIEHAIPDLSTEQKLLVREAGKKKNRSSQDDSDNTNKKQKSESVVEAAAAFLAKAREEILLQSVTENDT